MSRIEILERLMVADEELLKALGVFIEAEDVTPEILAMKQLVENARREVIQVLAAV